MLVTDHYKSLKRAKERNLNYGHYFSLITKSSKRIYKIKTDEQKKKNVSILSLIQCTG